MKHWAILLIAFFMLVQGHAQEEFNYDETKVPAYQLPELLATQKGQKIRNVKAWEKKRRPEILNIFEEQVYGRIPSSLRMTSFRVIEEGRQTPYPNAKRKQVEMAISKDGKELIAHLLIYLPESEKKVPVFLGYNFYGNHTVTNDPKVMISNSWARNNPSYGIIHNQLTEQSRGVSVESWCIETILLNGFGIATIYYGDIDPDRDDFDDGIHPFAYAPGQTRPAATEWGSISAWSWGLSRAMDYLETDEDIDASKVAVMGHSRLGKTALWAGACDQRFALVISNNSGCGGAALSRRRYGETVRRINTNFPHWFCRNFKAYNDAESYLPVDQHQLIALMAPRPVYIASALEDRWADPKGEYLSGFHASPAYHLYGLTGLVHPEQPPVHQPVMNHIGYHIREGAHAVKLYDWEQYIRFANQHFFK